MAAMVAVRLRTTPSALSVTSALTAKKAALTNQKDPGGPGPRPGWFPAFDHGFSAGLVSRW